MNEVHCPIKDFNILRWRCKDFIFLYVGICNRKQPLLGQTLNLFSNDKYYKSRSIKDMPFTVSTPSSDSQTKILAKPNILNNKKVSF